MYLYINNLSNSFLFVSICVSVFKAAHFILSNQKEKGDFINELLVMFNIAVNRHYTLQVHCMSRARLKLVFPVKCWLQALKQSSGLPAPALVRGAADMYLVDAQYFQVLPFYNNYCDHMLTPQIYLIVLEGFHIGIGICTLFLKREEMGVGW